MNITDPGSDTEEQWTTDDQAKLSRNSFHHEKQSLTSVATMPTSDLSAKPHIETQKEQQHRALIAAALERYNKSLFHAPDQLTLPPNHTMSSHPNHGNIPLYSKPTLCSDNNKNEHLRHHGRRETKADARKQRRESKAGAQKQRNALPSDHDVLFGRSKSQKLHPGNNYLRKLCDNYRPHYNRAGRKEKMQLSRTIVNVVKSRGGCFLKFDYSLKSWFRVSDEEARQKVGHMLRDGRSQEPTEP